MTSDTPGKLMGLKAHMAPIARARQPWTGAPAELRSSDDGGAPVAFRSLPVRPSPRLTLTLAAFALAVPIASPALAQTPPNTQLFNSPMGEPFRDPAGQP